MTSRVRDTAGNYISPDAHQEIDIAYVDIPANVGIVELPGHVLVGPALIDARLVEIVPIEGVVSETNTPDFDVWALSEDWEASGDPGDESEAVALTGGLLDVAPVQWMLDLGGATGGTYKLEVTTNAFGSTTEETAAINWNASTGQIASALALLTTVISSEPDVRIGFGGEVLIELEGYIVGDNVTAFTISENNLTGGSPASLEPFTPEVVPPVLRPTISGAVLYLDAGEPRRIGVRMAASAQPTGGMARVLIRSSRAG